ncbi:MAG: hypothetical protein ACRC9X_06390 [Bacteroidales bacterium]
MGAVALKSDNSLELFKIAVPFDDAALLLKGLDMSIKFMMSQGSNCSAEGAGVWRFVNDTRINLLKHLEIHKYDFRKKNVDDYWDYSMNANDWAEIQATEFKGKCVLDCPHEVLVESCGKWLAQLDDWEQLFGDNGYEELLDEVSESYCILEPLYKYLYRGGTVPMRTRVQLQGFLNHIYERAMVAVWEIEDKQKTLVK